MKNLAKLQTFFYFKFKNKLLYIFFTLINIYITFIKTFL
jgi:hypothetical protein